MQMFSTLSSLSPNPDRVRQIQEYLETVRRMSGCPTVTELGEYYLKLLPNDQSKLIQAHVARCPACTRTLAELQGYLQEDASTQTQPEPTAWWENLKISVATLLQDITPHTVPALAALRQGHSADPLEPMIYQAEQTLFLLQVEMGKENLKTLRGQVIDETVGSSFTALLWKTGSELPLRSEPSSDGNFALHDIEPGHYDLIITDSRGLAYHISDFVIS